MTPRSDWGSWGAVLVPGSRRPAARPPACGLTGQPGSSPGELGQDSLARGHEGVWKPAPRVHTRRPREAPPAGGQVRARGSSPKLGEEAPAASRLLGTPPGSRGASVP